MAYKVTSPLVITKKEDGSDLYLYEGAVVPDFVSDDEVKRLSADKLIEKAGDESAKSAAKGSKPAAPSN
jgi:hypothetical protein